MSEQDEFEQPKPPRFPAFRTAVERVSDWINKLAKESPSRLALVVFTLIILLFTLLLELPAATVRGLRAPLVDAFFTATSAVCVTGLVTVDTATYWSAFGQAIIMVGMVIGGLGVMTLASILGMAVSRHMGLTQRFLAASENQSRLGEVGSLIRAVALVSATGQALLFLALIPFFHKTGDSLLGALWHAVFMSVSIFNNGGFIIMPEGLAPYVGDWSLATPVILGTFLGAIGFPVILDMARSIRRPERWNLTTKLTLVTYFAVFALSALLIGLLEWHNPSTLGPLGLSDRISATLLHAADTRSSGLATLDIGLMNQTTWFVMDALDRKSVV